MNLSKVKNFDDALIFLSENPNTTVTELRELVARMPANPENDTSSLLYSGSINDGAIWASDIAKNIGLSNNKISIIDNTDAGELMLYDDFIITLRNSAKKENLNFDEIYSGRDENGARINNNSLWDDVSRRFIENSSGKVITITPFSPADSLFAATEFPALLNNPNITHIDGISKSQILSIFNEVKAAGGSDLEALDTARKMVQASSFNHIQDIDIAIDTNGQIIKIGLGEKFTSGLDNILPSLLPENEVGKISLSDTMPNIEHINNDILDALRVGSGYLEKIGVVGDILSLVIATIDAKEAYDNGDKDGAAKIISEWWSGFIGSIAGGAAAISVTAPMIKHLLAFGTPGQIAATLLTLGAGIAGSIGGEKAALYLLEKGQELKLFITSAAQDLMDNISEFWQDIQNHIGDISDDLITSLDWFIKAIAASLRTDPLIIDMKGDGLALDSWQNSKARFDLNNDGITEDTGWTKTNNDDSYLVIDKNANGKIDNISEMFGNQNTAGFDELKLYDSNNDNLINIKDSQFNMLKIWNDKNANGTFDEGEITSISENRITQISLNSKDSFDIIEGNSRTRISEIVFSDGQTRVIHEVFFAFNSQSRIYDNSDEQLGIGFTPNIISMMIPLSRGYGALKSWQVSSTIDPVLLNMALDIINLKPKDFNLIEQKFENFLFRWAGVQNVTEKEVYTAILEMYKDFDPKKVAFLEKITGSDLIFMNPRSFPMSKNAWNLVFDELLTKFLVQGTFKEIFSNASYDFSTDNLHIGSSLEEIINRITSLSSSIRVDNFVNYAYIKKILILNKGQFPDTDFETKIDKMMGIIIGVASIKDFTFTGKVVIGNDSENNGDLLGDSANDIIRGSNNNDNIFASSGDDFIHGNKGDDYI